MTVTLATSIQNPIAKQKIRLRLTASTGNFVRLWCTSAPIGSALRAKLDKNKATRVHVLEVDSGRDEDYTPDTGGVFTFAAEELTKGATSYGGGYQGAPDANKAETRIGETVVSLHVASGLRAELGAGSDKADLILYVSDTSIIETTLAVHGIATPAIAKPKSPAATTAALDTNTLAALALLSGTAAATALGALSAVADDIIDRFNAHLTQSGVHANNDGDNAIPPDFKGAQSPVALARTIAAILKALAQHIRNEDPNASPTGIGTGNYHQISSINVVDWPSLPLFTATAKIAEHVRGLADAWRAYEAHRVSTAHATPDTVNALAVLPQLLAVHRLFLTTLAALSPNSPPEEHDAKTTLVHGAGFEEL